MAKTIDSFVTLGEVFGIKPKAPKKRKPFVCRKCGEEMYHVPNTNVFICMHVDKDGGECGNQVFTSRAF